MVGGKFFNFLARLSNVWGKWVRSPNFPSRPPSVLAVSQPSPNDRYSLCLDTEDIANRKETRKLAATVGLATPLIYVVNDMWLPDRLML